MTKVFQVLQEWLPRLQAAKRVWVAYSGGLDSTVLLHQVAQLLPGVTAIHVNHQLSADADAWQLQCEQVARGLGCEFVSARVAVSAAGGLEHAARTARYRVFTQQLGEGDVLLTAHHGCDQAETLLYRLLRGAGLRGLAGVPRQRSLQPGQDGPLVVRPFLALSRTELEAYAAQHGLQWVSDESNKDERFDRNYLRHSLLPLIQQRWPQAVGQIAKTARLLAESNALLEDYLNEDLARCDLRSERLGCSLALEALQSFSWAKQKHVLRVWFIRHHVQLPGEQQFTEIQKLMMAAADAIPQLSWGDPVGSPQAGLAGCTLLRYRGRLYLIPRLGSPPQLDCRWHTAACCELGDGFRFSATAAVRGLPAGEYRLRSRCGGERCLPDGRRHSQTLKKLLQEYALEPWLRDRVPLVYRGTELVAVGDLWLCDGVAVAQGWLPQWRFDQDFAH